MKLLHPTINSVILQLKLIPYQIINTEKLAQKVIKKEGFTLKVNKHSNCQLFVKSHFKQILTSQFLVSFLKPFIINLLKPCVVKPFRKVKGKYINIHSSGLVPNLKGFSFQNYSSVENVDQFIVRIEQEPGTPDIPLTSSMLNNIKVLNQSNYIRIIDKHNPSLVLKILNKGYFTFISTNPMQFKHFLTLSSNLVCALT
jgi:hypothetical protein